jgi:hypothetical protein
MKVTVENCQPPQWKVFPIVVLLFFFISIVYIIHFGLQSYIYKCKFLIGKALFLLYIFLSLAVGILSLLRDFVGAIVSNW